MQIFKTDKKLFLINELKSWLWTFVFVTIIYLGLQQFFSMAHDKLIGVAVILLLLKLADAITQFHITEIHVNAQKNQLTFVLHCILSGEKIKRYELSDAASELKNNSSKILYGYSRFLLTIFLEQKGVFRISNRYGFSLATVTSVHEAINEKGIH